MFLVIEVDVTVKESVPAIYPPPLLPNWVQILTVEPVTSPRFTEYG